ncbi:MAG TPA: BON domain-containing protein [Pyrinomonadaceae bacterium]|nr:BON domain-containing protein [Pyrinomonadaceae bacterium]
MSRKTVLTLAAGVALAAVAAGCGGGDNANANNANRANTNANNSNSVVVTNTNANANTAGGAYNRNYNSRAEYNASEANYRSEARNAGQSIGQGLEDGWIHFKVRAALAAADDLRDSTINVDVDNNVVTLRGSVESPAQKTKAATVAKVEGVKNVVNRLEIRAGDANKNGDAKTAGNTNTKTK